MRKIYILLILALLMSTIFVNPVMAQGPTGDWVSGITCQNLEAEEAKEVRFNFFQNGQATPSLVYPDTIPGNGTLKYFTANTPAGLPADFFGSAVVSSDKRLFCSVNTQSTGTGTTTSPYRIGTSSGLNEQQIGSVSYVPQITKTTTWNTYMAIQNTTSASVEIKIQYYDRTSGAEVVSAAQTVTIAANSGYVAYPETNGNLPATFYGSAKITSMNPTTAKIGVIVNFYNIGTDYQTSQLQSYNAFPAGAKTLYAPRVVRKYYGYNSGISIQNVSSSVQTTLTLDYTFANGTLFSYTTPVVSPSASYIVYTPNITELSSVDGFQMTKRYAALKVTANAAGASIVGITNLDNRGNASDNDGASVPTENIGKGATANMALDGTATTTLFFAQVAKHISGFSGGIIISNTTSNAGSCNITFAGQPSTADMNGVGLPANGQISLYLPNNSNLVNGFNASVKAVCTQNVFGTYNFSIEPGMGKYGDSYIEANALNQ
jgi:hypothetical protein